MRLFIALVPPPEILEDLKGVQKKLLGGQGKVGASAQAGWDRQAGALIVRQSPWRAAGADQLHLTLQFLGDGNTVHQKEEIRHALEAVGPKHAPVVLTPSHLGAFPHEERASVVWAGIEGSELRTLAQDIESALLALGIRRDRPFSPHITIARSKIPQNAQKRLEPLASARWSEKSWRAQEFVLFESHARLGGQEHLVVQKYRLGGE